VSKSYALTRTILRFLEQNSLNKKLNRSEVSVLLLSIKDGNVDAFKQLLSDKMRCLTLRDDLSGPIKSAPSTWKYEFKT